MPLKLITKLVFRNFKALGKTIVPFMVAAAMMFGLEYVLISLIFNEYLKERHELLPEILGYINVLIAILAVVFVVYANNFVTKERKQEFALDMILGMEKKHIRLMLFIETLIQYVVVTFLSIVGGYLFGTLIFMALNKMVQGSGVTLMNYPFSMRAAIFTALIIAFVFIVIFIFNNIRVTFQSPIQLMHTKKSMERKTNKWIVLILFILGALALGRGYFIALTTVGVVASLLGLFKAVVLVVIGTYLLFMSFIILFLQFLQNNKKIYYRKNNFFMISGMLARIKAQAVSLASIAILCTFLMVILGLSFTTYRGIEAQIEGSLKQDYEVLLSADDNGKVTTDVNALENEINQYAHVDKYRLSKLIVTPMYLTNNKLIPFTAEENQRDTSKIVYAIVTDNESHNNYNDEDLSLNNNEVAVGTNVSRFKDIQSLHFDILDDTVKSQVLDENYIPTNLAVDGLYVVTKDDKTFEAFRDHYRTYNTAKDTSDGPVPSDVENILSFNVKDELEQNTLNKHIDEINEKYGITIGLKSEKAKALYELNGGLVFVGVVVSIVLLIGMFLILYYKQLSEGFSDKENYMIMQRVGLPKELIKKTINKQILFIFGLPILTAIIHTLFASKIIYQVLGMLGINDKGLFLSSYFIIIFAIILIYGLMYLITSRIYLKIVNED